MWAGLGHQVCRPELPSNCVAHMPSSMLGFAGCWFWVLQLGGVLQQPRRPPISKKTKQGQLSPTCLRAREPAAMPAVSFETGHTDMVHDAQLDYYGRRLATCSSDKTIKVFEVVGETQQHLADLRGHEGPVWQVAWAHPKFGSLLASCSFDHRVIVWKESQDNQWSQVSW